MSKHGAYGRYLADALRIRAPVSFVARGAPAKRLAVTELRTDVADDALTQPIAREDAWLAILQLRDWPKRILWADGVAMNAQPLAAGDIAIFDLRRSFTGHRVRPIHQVVFYLPRRAVNMIAEMEGGSSIDEFNNDLLVGARDDIVWQLGLSLLPAFERPREANPLFVDHVTSAAAAHLVCNYGVGEARRVVEPAPLSARDCAKTKERIAEHIDGDVSISDLATECGRPISSFSAAFAKTAGQSPHQWLLELRVERSVALLADQELSIDDVALACGFADGRHFRRVFVRRMGMTPDVWRIASRH